MKKVTRVLIVVSAPLLLSLDAGRAQTNEPVQVGTRTILTSPPPVYFKNKSVLPPNPGAKTLSQSLAPTTNFLALLGTGDVPDTDGAVGRDHVMTMLNPAFNVQTRTGVSVRTNSSRSFWGSTNVGPNDSGPFDPRITYDSYSDRWIAAADLNGMRTDSAILIGVSMTSNPTNGWNLRRVKADTNSLRWAD